MYSNYDGRKVGTHKKSDQELIDFGDDQTTDDRRDVLRCGLLMATDDLPVKGLMLPWSAPNGQVAILLLMMMAPNCGCSFSRRQNTDVLTLYLTRLSLWPRQSVKCSTKRYVNFAAPRHCWRAFCFIFPLYTISLTSSVQDDEDGDVKQKKKERKRERERCLLLLSLLACLVRCAWMQKKEASSTPLGQS